MTSSAPAGWRTIINTRPKSRPTTSHFLGAVICIYNLIGCRYNLLTLRIEFNPAKDTKNQAKHGVPLALAERFDWVAGQPAPARTVGDEPRWKMVTELDGTVYAVVFTRRADVLWIISLRRASRKERRDYEG